MAWAAYTSSARTPARSADPFSNSTVRVPVAAPASPGRQRRLLTAGRPPELTSLPRTTPPQPPPPRITRRNLGVGRAGGSEGCEYDALTNSWYVAARSASQFLRIASGFGASRAPPPGRQPPP